MKRTDVTPRLALLTAGHFTIDAYSSFFAPLLPLLMTKLHLNLTLVGTLVALASVSSSFAQPLWGWLSDRMHRPWFVWLGPLVAAVFISAIGFAHSFTSLVVLLMLGGLGVAAFHPQAAALAGESSPRRAMAMSFFITGGTLGFSLGPEFAGRVVGWFGIERTWIAVIPGAVMAVILGVTSRRLTPPKRMSGPRPAIRELGPVARPLALLYAIVVCRSAVSYGYMTFLPIYLHQHGFSEPQYTHLTSAYLFTGAVGGLLGGYLAERIGARRVVIQSFAGAILPFIGFLVLPDVPGIACVLLGSFIMQGSLPVNVVLGQELSPRHSSVISSLLMGAAWGMGALLIGPIGAFGDLHGIRSALALLAGLLVVGLGCAIALPLISRPLPVPEMVLPGAIGK
jgi:MFS transporter, FSR family, fosmidomycin resistance protein